MTDLPQSVQAANPPAVGRNAPVKGKGKPRFLPTVVAALATFAVMFEFLAFQLSSGNDPALGSSAGQVVATRVATVSPQRPVINRRVVKTRVVQLPPKQAVASSAVPVSSGSTSTAAATPAAAPSTAPAPAPAAAPAPAPAPVTASS